MLLLAKGLVFRSFKLADAANKVGAPAEETQGPSTAFGYASLRSG